MSSMRQGRVGAQRAADRLNILLSERKNAAIEERAKLDQRIWKVFGETWAIVFTDLVGFSRKTIDNGIINFLQVIRESEILFEPLVAQNAGTLIKQEGDSMILLFRDPEDALNCCYEIVEATRNYNREAPEDQHILVKCGIGYGKILKIGAHDLFGTEVNHSSRLGEDIAEADEILVTESVREYCNDHTFTEIDYKFTNGDPAYRLNR